MDRWVHGTLYLTTVCLVASGALILPTLAGLGPSPVLAGLLFGLTVLSFLGRERCAALPSVLGYDLEGHARTLWIGWLFATLVVLVSAAGSPAELQTLGGVIGFLGMVNYFIRPIYVGLVAVFGQVLSRTES